MIDNTTAILNNINLIFTFTATSGTMRGHKFGAKCSTSTPGILIWHQCKVYQHESFNKEDIHIKYYILFF